MITAAYVRVSSVQQDDTLQVQAVERWAAAQGEQVTIYRDTFTGRTMERPGWRRLEAAIRAGEVSRLVTWRLDRLGRTAAGLAVLLEELSARGVVLVSLTEGLDLSTPAGRLMAGIIGSVAAYETEIRRERQEAGIATARAAGRRWGGSRPGRRKASAAQREAIAALRASGHGLRAVAAAVGLSVGCVRRVLADYHNVVETASITP
jgi:DNA invertase Pin-like site-specific DNA recombinase